MLTLNATTTTSTACPSCGAYGGSQHRPTCQPGRLVGITLGRCRRATRDARTSAIFTAQRNNDELLLRSLGS